MKNEVQETTSTFVLNDEARAALGRFWRVTFTTVYMFIFTTLLFICLFLLLYCLFIFTTILLICLVVLPYCLFEQKQAALSPLSHSNFCKVHDDDDDCHVQSSRRRLSLILRLKFFQLIFWILPNWFTTLFFRVCRLRIRKNLKPKTSNAVW